MTDRPEPAAVPPGGSGRAHAVRGMFNGIAGRYDFLNRLLSLGLDTRWRKEAVRLGLEKQPADILDVATGTGDLAFELARQAPAAAITGLDFSPGMLEVARRKETERASGVGFVEGDATALPFGAGSFDLVLIAYGLRNLDGPADGLREFFRVLRPGGRLVILEFPPPPGGAFGALVRFYFRHVLPRIGGLVSGSRAAYTYLPESVEGFLTPRALAALLQEAGFSSVRSRLQSGGLSAVHVADRAGTTGGRQ